MGCTEIPQLYHHLLEKCQSQSVNCNTFTNPVILHFMLGLRSGHCRTPWFQLANVYLEAAMYLTNHP